jgi:hypothetical protein
VKKNKKFLNKEKLNLIQYAALNFDMKSFADLGGVWNVDAGYTFFALEECIIDRAYLVDTTYTPRVLEKAKNFRRLTVMQENFGSKEVAEKIGHVDAIFMFDILEHQVNPDWDEVISNYAPHTDTFLVYAQQLVGYSPKTIRLVDLPFEEYLKLTPYDMTREYHRTVLNTIFNHPTAIHSQHQRPYRDIHNIWQWGITDKDLKKVMKKNGFKLVYKKNCGPFKKLEHIEDHSFIFRKENEV